jgi:peptidyl-prolyl cis-trans isomerase SurA
MKRNPGIGAVLLALAAAGGVWAAATNTNDVASAWMLDGVAAQVNDETITVSEVMQEIRGSAWIELSKEEREKSLRKLYADTLDAFINRRLILAAARDAEMKLQPWVVSERIQEIVDTRFGGNRTRLLDDLTAHHVNYEDWKKMIEEEMLLMAMRTESVDKQVTVSPREVRDFFATNRQALATSPRVHACRITLLSKAGEERSAAERGELALKELDGGADFADVAHKYSRDSFALKGGDWGWVDPEDLAPALVKALADLKPGQHSRLIPLGEQTLIVKKLEEKGNTALTLDEAWSQIERRLRVQKAESLYREWIGRLRRRNYVKLFELPPTPVSP